MSGENVLNKFSHPDATGNNALELGGTVNITGSINRVGRKIVVPVGGNAKIGATAGWSITGADTYTAALPQSQTSSTLLIPVNGLEVGDTITDVAVHGKVTSAGNNVTLISSVRKLTATSGAITDVELGTDNIGTVTADALIGASNLKVTGLTEVMAGGESIYVLLTGTTAASTDIDISSLTVTVTRS